MSFLPYGDTTKLGWMSALGTSVVLHAGIAVALIAVGSTTLSITASAAVSPPVFEVSITELDADTLAGLIEQSGVAGSDGDDPDVDPIETAEPGTSEISENGSEIAGSSNEGGGIELPLEQPEIVTPETPAEEAFETVVSAEIATIEPLTELPDVIEPLDEQVFETLPEIVENISVNPVVIDTLPSPVMPEEAAIVSSETVLSGVETFTNAVSSTESELVETLESVGVEQTLNATEPTLDVETVASNLSAISPETTSPVQVAPPPAPPTEQDLAVRDLINRIRSAPNPSCGVALPRRDGVDGVGLALIAAQDRTMEDFAQAVLTAEDLDVRQTRTLIDPRQCPALEYVAQTGVYPAMQIGIQMEQTTVTSGDTLTGAMRGIGGRFLTLVLVDDNGVVTDLQRFIAATGTITRFDVPVTRVGLTRETRPLILALATERPPTALRSRMGQLAVDVFLDDVTTNLGEVRIGLVAIDIR